MTTVIGSDVDDSPLIGDFREYGSKCSRSCSMSAVRSTGSGHISPDWETIILSIDPANSEMTCISLLPLEILRIWIKSCKQKPSALDTFSRSWPLYHYAYIFHSVYRFLTLWSQPSAYLRRSIIDAATTQSQEN